MPVPVAEDDDNRVESCNCTACCVNCAIGGFMTLLCFVLVFSAFVIADATENSHYVAMMPVDVRDVVAHETGIFSNGYAIAYATVPRADGTMRTVRIVHPSVNPNLAPTSPGAAKAILEGLKFGANPIIYTEPESSGDRAIVSNIGTAVWWVAAVVCAILLIAYAVAIAVKCVRKYKGRRRAAANEQFVYIAE